MNQPSVCIVLINWNQLTLTMDCLDSLFEIQYENFKIVLVDNCSNDDPTQEVLLNHPEVILLRQDENLGFAEGNNVGFRYAYQNNFNLVMALNNDTVVAPDFLNILVNDLQNSAEKKVAVSPKIYFKHNPRMIWAMGGKVSFSKVKGFSFYRKQLDNGQFEVPITPDYLTGCCLLIKAKVLESFHGFDQAYFAYYEDTDLSFRLTEAGYEIGVVPKSVIWHVAGGSSRPNKKKPPFLTYLGTRNRLMFFNRHTTGLHKTYSVLYITIGSLLSIVFHTITFQLDHSRELFRGLIHGLTYKTTEGKN